MKIISHRGNLYGPDPKNENTHDAIDKALSMGFDVEIDLWYQKGKLMLGHDFPQRIFEPRINPIYWPSYWIHCKNLEAFYQIPKIFDVIHRFMHDSDPITITSRGKVWMHPDSIKESFECQNVLDFSNTIIVLPERFFRSKDFNKNVSDEKKFLSKFYGICTDYPVSVRRLLESC